MVATALGEFGAEVIKVEQPGAGDPLRTWGDRKDGVGLVWKSVSRNKRCVTLDLRQPEGQELFHQLSTSATCSSSATGPAPWPAGASTTSRCTAGHPQAGDAPHQRLRPGRPLERPTRASARWPRP